MFSMFQTSTTLLHIHTLTHTSPPVAITNKGLMTLEEVCVCVCVCDDWTEQRNPTGPSHTTATGTSGAFVHACRMCVQTVPSKSQMLLDKCHIVNSTNPLCNKNLLFICGFRHVLRCVTLLQAAASDRSGRKDFVFV